MRTVLEPPEALVGISRCVVEVSVKAHSGCACICVCLRHSGGKRCTTGRFLRLSSASGGCEQKNENKRKETRRRDWSLTKTTETERRWASRLSSWVYGSGGTRA